MPRQEKGGDETGVVGVCALIADCCLSLAVSPRYAVPLCPVRCPAPLAMRPAVPPPVRTDSWFAVVMPTHAHALI